MMIREKIKAMRANSSNLENNKAFWNKDADKELRNMYYDGYGITEIAIKIGRTENSVFQRIKKLKLEEKKYNTCGKKKSSDKCLCSQCEFFMSSSCTKGACMISKEEGEAGYECN